MSQFEKETMLWTIEKCINQLDNIDDLNKAREIINDRRNSLARKTKYSLVVGEEVTITGSGKISYTKGGNNHFGVRKSSKRKRRLRSHFV